MIQVPDNQRIEAASTLKRWQEWAVQSGMLLGASAREVIHSGWNSSTTATVCATTPRAVTHIVDQLDLDSLQDGDIIAEAGPGPGPIVQAVLRKVRARIIYIAVELKPEFAEYLEETITDSRLVVINDSAENLVEIVQRHGESAKRVVSSMPFSTNEAVTAKVLEQILEILDSKGKFVMANFKLKSMMRVIDAFGRENCKTDFVFNVPPPPLTLLTVQAQKPNGRKHS